MTVRDDLWDFIPAIYRRRDPETGGALRALVDVLGEQAQMIEDDIGRLYNDWFIETCEDWVVPYIADLLGSVPLAGTGEPLPAAEQARFARALPQRLEIANALRNRRRKGCVAVIQQLAYDVSRWSAQVVEFGTGLAISQDLDHVVRRGGTARISNGAALAELGGPQAPFARLADMRSADSLRTPGFAGPSGIGVYIARLDTEPVERGEAYCVDEEGATCFCFDALGRDVPLFHPALVTALGPQLAGPILPAAFALPAPRASASRWRIDPALYGPGKPVMVWRQTTVNGAFDAVAPQSLMPADLGDWTLRPPPGFVAIDTRRGRLAFAEREAPRRVQVSYRYAMPAPLGGGRYKRARDTVRYDRVIKVGIAAADAHDRLHDAVVAWQGSDDVDTLIEFQDSGLYNEERLSIDLSGRERNLTIRAAPGTRPVLRLLNYEAGGADAMHVVGGPGRLVLDGLTIGGRGIALSDQAGEVAIRHCTLVPGWTAHSSVARGRPEAPSLALQNCTGQVRIESSIVGPIFVRADSHIDAALPLAIADSIVDAADGTDVLLSPSGSAYACLSLRRVTVLGALRVHSVALLENSILTGPLTVMRRQLGCLRFCFVPAGSRTPRPFACLPGPADPAFAPIFTSRRFGSPGYCQLAPTCPQPIVQGADDQSELGVYHDLYQPQRDANLRLRLEEHLPASTAVGIIYTT